MFSVIDYVTIIRGFDDTTIEVYTIDTELQLQGSDESTRLLERHRRHQRLMYVVYKYIIKY